MGLNGACIPAIGLFVTTALFGQTGPLQIRDAPPSTGNETKEPDGGSQQSTILRVDSNLVLIRAQVLDRSDHFIAGLSAKNFQVFDERERRPVVNLSREDQPVSVGVVLDASRSMESAMKLTSSILTSFFTTAGPRDEYMAVVVRDRPEKAFGFIRDVDDVVRTLRQTAIEGETALLDSVYLAAHEMRKARSPRKALLVITDSDDNNSRYRDRDLKNFMREADVSLYVLAVPCSDCPLSKPPSAERVLWNIADETGGRYILLDNEKDLPNALSKLDFRDSYLVGFRPSPLLADGKYHTVKLRVSVDDKNLRPRVLWRRGYYAPVNSTDVERTR